MRFAARILSFIYISRALFLVQQVVICHGLSLHREYETTKVIAFHKPPGVVTSNVSQDDRPTVFDYFDDEVRLNAGIRSKLHAVGRLDVDTSGLLLLTNDSLLVHAATNPSAKVAIKSTTGSETHTRFEKLEKQYTALVMGSLSDDSLEKLRSGIYLGEKIGLTQPAEVEILDNPSPKSTLVSIVIKEGKNRQVRRMFHAIHSGVMKLHRDRIGLVDLGDLNEGEYRVLSNDEIENNLRWPIRMLDRSEPNRNKRRPKFKTRTR